MSTSISYIPTPDACPARTTSLHDDILTRGRKRESRTGSAAFPRAAATERRASPWRRRSRPGGTACTRWSSSWSVWACPGSSSSRPGPSPAGRTDNTAAHLLPAAYIVLDLFGGEKLLRRIRGQQWRPSEVSNGHYIPAGFKYQYGSIYRLCLMDRSAERQTRRSVIWPI